MARIHTMTLDDKVFDMGFKVVTQDLKSLGLRNNPNIITYPLQEWFVLQPDQIVEGPDDFGGIWVTRIPSSAKGLRKYMKKQHSQETRIFQAALGEIIYFNNYRIKTAAIYLFKELFD